MSIAAAATFARVPLFPSTSTRIPMPAFQMNLHVDLALQVTGLVSSASAANLAGMPLSLAASASATRRRRQLLATTLSPQQARPVTPYAPMRRMFAALSR